MKGLRYFLILGLVLSLFSCKKFSGSQEVPAYLKIEPWTFTTNYDIEGAATQAITDAWVYINGNYLGCYELRNHEDGYYVMVPILEKGAKKFHIYPGIKLNGIASTRIQYPFYKPYICQRDLSEGVVETLSPVTRYYSVDSTAMTFEMKEGFEEYNNIGANVKIDTTYSHAVLEQISHRNNPNAWLDPFDTINHYRSGHIHLGDSITRFNLASRELRNLPSVGNYVLMELDYKCSAEILIGMYIMTSQDGLMDKELYYLKTSNTWKKAYINFSPTITENNGAVYFKFYLKGAVAAGESADFYFDNIKLIYVD